MLFKRKYEKGDKVTFFLKDDDKKFIATFKIDFISCEKSFYYLRGCGNHSRVGMHPQMREL